MKTPEQPEEKKCKACNKPLYGTIEQLRNKCDDCSPEQPEECCEKCHRYAEEYHDCRTCPCHASPEQPEENIKDIYVRQMAENHAIKIDTNFWLVVKKKPKYMPSFLYKMVIKELVEFQEHRK